MGTTSPSSRLDVVDSGSSTVAEFGSTSGANVFVNLQNTSNALGFIGYQSSDLTFYTNNTEKARILAGGGLTFNGDTATANALADYEEGSWTPTAANFDGTLTIESADYVKVGRLVHINMYISFSNTTDTSNVRIDGLPFTVSGQTNHYSLISAHSNGNIPDLALRPQGTTTSLTAVYLNNSDGDAKPNYNHVRGQFNVRS